MLERTTTRALPVLNQVAPVAPACCNVCRTCVTTNAIGLLTAAGAGVAAFLTRLVRR